MRRTTHKKPHYTKGQLEVLMDHTQALRKNSPDSNAVEKYKRIQLGYQNDYHALTGHFYHGKEGKK